MSRDLADDQPAVQGSPAAPDDWDHHWDAYGEAADGNPANMYRRELILRLLGRTDPGAVLIDIGSGQGEFAVAFAQLHPQVQVWGVEHSALGVRRSQQGAAAAGVQATFLQRDLLQSVELADGQPAATHALCSEVLEHVDDPVALMRNSINLLAPGAKVVVTVPGGPRSAFDRHIGHYRHFDARSLRAVLTDAGLEVDRVLRAGFPGFNLYKFAVLARGDKLINDVESRAPGGAPSSAEAMATGFFKRVFRINRDDFPLGWQMAAVAHVPAAQI